MFCLPLLGPLHNGAGLKQDHMHFWIYKRDLYSGRQRVPASLSTAGDMLNIRVGRRRRLSKPMVTPVHRLESVVSRSVLHQPRPTPTNSTARPIQPPCIAPSISYNYGGGRTPTDMMDPVLMLDNSAVESDSSVSQVGKPSRVKYYVLALLCIVLVIVTGIKYYYSVHSPGIVDISIESSLSLLAAGLMVSCMLSGCRSKGPDSPYLPTTNPPQCPVMMETEVEVPAVMARRDEVILELHPPSSTNVPMDASEPEKPPPYHLAILMPPKDRQLLEEVPPPTYDKAVVVR